jgi:L-threonylcarbamoyladenylate synthase
LLKKAGPLVAPSANPEGMEPAKTIKEAKEYFGERVDFYINGGKLLSPPSTLIEIKNKKIFIKRKGAVKIKEKYGE